MQIVDGELWAVYFRTNCLVRVNPSNGEVPGLPLQSFCFSLTVFVPSLSVLSSFLMICSLVCTVAAPFMVRFIVFPIGAHPSINSLSALAYDPETKSIFVTGRKWPDVFKIELSSNTTGEVCLQCVDPGLDCYVQRAMPLWHVPCFPCLRRMLTTMQICCRLCL